MGRHELPATHLLHAWADTSARPSLPRPDHNSQIEEEGNDGTQSEQAHVLCTRITTAPDNSAVPPGDCEREGAFDEEEDQRSYEGEPLLPQASGKDAEH